jgi:DNA invertase Pin-like site-specific DNA recombinase
METAESQSCVAYYRVSTQKQGRSGLGLEAQQRAVRDHLDTTNRKLIAEFVEIESGKNPDRPKLSEALKLCRLTRSKLIVARLDRLARNVAFVSRLMEAGVDFEAADFPQANRFTVHILAAVAEYEARLVSERTKAGLAAAKARSVKLGRRTPSSGHLPGLVKARQVILEKLQARTADLAPVIAEIQAAGFVSAKAVARLLSARGIRPAHADRWSPSSARSVLSRLSLRRSVSESRQAKHAAKQRWIASIAPVIADVRRSGYKTLTSIGGELNARGVSTFQGGRWTGTIVQKALWCLPEDQSKSIYLTRKQFASRLRPVIEDIQAAGKTGACAVASALNARGIPGLNGGLWRRIQVHQLLKRLSMVAQSQLTIAEWLPRVARIITEVRAAGHLSSAAMASELNARGVRACRGGCWTMRKVRDALRGMRRYKIDYEPKGDVALATQLDAFKAKNPKRSKGMHSAKSMHFAMPDRRNLNVCPAGSANPRVHRVCVPPLPD